MPIFNSGDIALRWSANVRLTGVYKHSAPPEPRAIACGPTALRNLRIGFYFYEWTSRFPVPRRARQSRRGTSHQLRVS